MVAFCPPLPLAHPSYDTIQNMHNEQKQSKQINLLYQSGFGFPWRALRRASLAEKCLRWCKRRLFGLTNLTKWISILFCILEIFLRIKHNMGFRIQVQALSSEWQILNICILYIVKASRFPWLVGSVILAILAHLDVHIWYSWFCEFGNFGPPWRPYRGSGQPALHGFPPN